MDYFESPSRLAFSTFQVGYFEQGFAECEVAGCEVPFSQREIQQRQKPRVFSGLRPSACNGAWHTVDEGLIAPAIEVAKERVAPIVLPADGIDRVYGRRVPGRITVSEPTVVALNRETQLPRRSLVVGRPALGHPGEYRERDLPQVGSAYRAGSALALWNVGSIPRLSHGYLRPSTEGVCCFVSISRRSASQTRPGEAPSSEEGVPGRR